MLHDRLLWIACLLAASLSAGFASAAEPDKSVGIEHRVPWTSSRLTGSPEPPSPYQTTRAFEHLQFEQPVELVALPGTDWLVMVELKGKVRAFRNAPQTRETKLVVDLAEVDKECRRAYGLAFSPNVAQDRLCYICYVQQDGAPNGSRVVRYRLRTLDPPEIDPASGELLLSWFSGGHNGGALHFGPDRMLYISTGDGSSPFPTDIHSTGQNLTDLLSCILRIDVSGREQGQPYRIPADNPFVGLSGARGEIWAYGLRNPWKMSFDPLRGDLWVGDVGWEMFEMIYRVERGGNYGWAVKEGSQDVLGERPRGPTPILPPTVEHSHVDARSITGGYVYTGERLPGLHGAYIYGDYVTGKVWALRSYNGKVSSLKELCTSPLAIVVFGVDQQGELYLVDHQSGTLHTLQPTPEPKQTQPFPRRLSETGLYSAVAKHELAPGVLPYSIVAEAWADGATSERFFALPQRTQLDEYDKTDLPLGHIKGQWRFPADGVIGKTVMLPKSDAPDAPRQRVETQILHYDGRNWNAYSYAWNPQQTDAELVPATGRDVPLTVTSTQGPRQLNYHIAARSECILCHTTRAGSLLAFDAAQLARVQRYPLREAEQLATLEHLQLFKQPPKAAPPLVDPHGPSGTLEQKVRSYLHVNCGQCHRRGGGGTAAFDVRHELTMKQTLLLDQRPTQGTFGIHAAQVIAAGAPERSVLLYRMAKLGRGRMPHFGSQQVDVQGVRLLSEWIRSLGSPSTPSPSADKLLDDTLDEAQRAAAVKASLAGPSSALSLMLALDAKPEASAARQEIVRQAASHADRAVTDLFIRYMDDAQRQKFLPSDVKPAAILALAGDAERGRRLFLEAAGVACRNCHKVHSQGGQVGPELSVIGRKLTKPQLLESILEPSKAIDPKFVAYLVETSSGHVHQGLLEQQSDEALVLRTPQNQSLRLPKQEVETFVPQRVSLMPELLLRDLQPAEIADLLEYLSSLR